MEPRNDLHHPEEMLIGGLISAVAKVGAMQPQVVADVILTALAAAPLKEEEA